jgi:chromate reductase
MTEFRLLGLSGSLRGASVNGMLVREAGRLMEGARFVEGSLEMPLYNGDLEDAEGIPGVVITLARQIADADAVVIATPEYNQSFSGVLKNALDWISRTEGNVWKDKPVALLSAASGRTGGARAQYALRLAMTPFRVRLMTGPEVMVAGAEREFDENGRLTGESYVKLLTTLMRSLKAEAAR